MAAKTAKAPSPKKRSDPYDLTASAFWIAHGARCLRRRLKRPDLAEIHPYLSKEVFELPFPLLVTLHDKIRRGVEAYLDKKYARVNRESGKQIQRALNRLKAQKAKRKRTKKSSKTRLNGLLVTSESILRSP